MRILVASIFLALIAVSLYPPLINTARGGNSAALYVVEGQISSAPYDFIGAGGFRGEGYSLYGGSSGVAWLVESNPSYSEGDLYFGSYSDRGLLVVRADTRYVKQVSPPAFLGESAAVAYAKYAGSNRLDVWVAVSREDRLCRTVVASTSSYEEYPAIASTGSGFAVVFYNSSDRDYYLVELDENCSVLAGYRVRDGNIYYRDAGQVASGSGGGMALFAYRDEGAGIDLYATLVSPSGWTTTGLTSGESGDESPGRNIAYIEDYDVFLVPYYGTTGSESKVGYILFWPNGTMRKGVAYLEASAPPGAFAYNSSLGVVYFVSGDELNLWLVAPSRETSILAFRLPGAIASSVYASSIDGKVLVAYTNSTGSYLVLVGLDGETYYEARIGGPNSSVEGLVKGNNTVAVFIDTAYGSFHVLRVVVAAFSLESGTAILYTLPEDSERLLDEESKYSLAGLLARANESIHAALAFFENKTLAELFVEAKNRGVEVGLVTDDDSLEYEAVQYMVSNGVEVVTDAGYEEDIGKNHTMHEKFIVVDGSHVVIGTANPTTTGLGSNYENVLVFVNTPILAAALEQEYRDLASGGFGPSDERDVIGLEFFLNTSNREPIVATVFAGPEHRLDWELEGLVESAETSIYMAEYIFTNSSTIKYLRQAILGKASSGLEVEGVFYWLLNLDTPGRFAYELREAGGKVAFSRGLRTLHAKSIVVDSKAIETGSYNPTGSATKYNDESIVVLYSPVLSSKLAEWIHSLYSEWSEPIWVEDYHPLILAVGLEPSFIEIYNPTSSPINLSVLVVGDSENLYSDDEGLYRFPSGVLEPGRSVIVAYNSTEFYQYYGFMPDYEIVDSDPSVPNVEPYLPSRFTGSLDFNSTGDEAVLGMLSPYDPEFIYMVDMVAYGASKAIPGATTASKPTATHPVLLRLGILDSVDYNETFTLSVSPAKRASSVYAESVPPRERAVLELGRASLVIESGGLSSLKAAIMELAKPPVATPIDSARLKWYYDVVARARGDYNASLVVETGYRLDPGTVRAYYLDSNGEWKPLQAVVEGARVKISLEPSVLNETPIILGGDPAIVGGTLAVPEKPASSSEPYGGWLEAMLGAIAGSATVLLAVLLYYQKRRRG